jgi:hypothetical protein
MCNENVDIFVDDGRILKIMTCLLIDFGSLCSCEVMWYHGSHLLQIMVEIKPRLGG